MYFLVFKFSTLWTRKKVKTFNKNDPYLFLLLGHNVYFFLILRFLFQYIYGYILYLSSTNFIFLFMFTLSCWHHNPFTSHVWNFVFPPFALFFVAMSTCLWILSSPFHCMSYFKFISEDSCNFLTILLLI